MFPSFNCFRQLKQSSGWALYKLAALIWCFQVLHKAADVTWCGCESIIKKRFSTGLDLCLALFRTFLPGFMILILLVAGLPASRYLVAFDSVFYGFWVLLEEHYMVPISLSYFILPGWFALAILAGWRYWYFVKHLSVLDSFLYIYILAHGRRVSFRSFLL
jgi:hypothetical protein